MSKTFCLALLACCLAFACAESLSEQQLRWIAAHTVADRWDELCEIMSAQGRPVRENKFMLASRVFSLWDQTISVVRPTQPMCCNEHYCMPCDSLPRRTTCQGVDNLDRIKQTAAPNVSVWEVAHVIILVVIWVGLIACAGTIVLWILTICCSALDEE